ncbi:MAG: hypothetical protein R2879_06975 [Saprospiraceae bacterium]
MTNLAKNSSDLKVLANAGLFAAVSITGGFILLLWLESWLLNIFPDYGDDLVAGLMLLWTWIVIGALVRSVEKLKSRIQGWKLLILSLLVTLVGTMVFQLFLKIIPNWTWVASHEGLGKIDFTQILFMSITGLIFGLISLIMLRVKSKLISGLLIVLVVTGVILLIYYLL